MTISNFSASVVNGTVYCNWTATLANSFLYEDAVMISQRPPGVTSWSGAVIQGAIYQVVDSATTSPIPPPTNLVPFRYITIFWDEVLDDNGDPTTKYEVKLDGVVVTTRSGGRPTYTYKTPRLDSGVHALSVTSIDAAGNRDPTPSILDYEIEAVPPPVRSTIVSQSGATNLTVTLVEPLGWPT